MRPGRALPLNETAEGLPTALCAMEKLADLVPDEVGAKATTAITALCPDATLEVTCVNPNCDESAPVSLRLEIDRFAVPVFCAERFRAEVLPTATSPKVSEVCGRERVGARAVPATDREAGLPDALWVTDRDADRLPGPPVGVNVTVTVCAAAPGRIVREAGLTPNCAESAPTRAMDDTRSVSVPVLETVKVCVPGVPPTVTLPKESEVVDNKMPGVPVAVPLRAMDDGLPPALWATDTEAALFPANPVGVNVTVTVCAAPPGRIVNEAGLTENCAESAPVRVIDVTLSVSVPVLETVKLCVPGVPPMATFPNDSKVADRTRVDAPVAVPLRATADGLPVALWATDRVADRLPANPVGVNVTVTVCAAPPGRIVNEVGLTVNCAASVPDTVMPVILSVSVPVFDTVKVCVPGVPPMATFPNDSKVADRTRVDAPVAVPLRATADGLAVALWATDREAALFPANPDGVNVTVTV